MAWEKTRGQLVDEAHYKDHMGLTFKLPPSRKYKKDSPREPDVAGLAEGDEFRAGLRVIAETSPNNPTYYLCEVLDFETVNTYWRRYTQMIVQILESSRLGDPDVGRLKIVGGIGMHTFRLGEGLRLREVGKANWHKYLPSGKRP